MALNFTFAETKTAHPAMKFDDEFIESFNNAWGFLKENPGHQATVLFENAAARDKWFNTAKAYGAQHADDVFVSKVKGTGSDDKASGKLVFKMESGTERDKRIAAQKRRADMAAEVRAHGLDVKRGVGSNLDDVHAALMKKTPQEREAMRKKVAESVKKESDAKTVQHAQKVAPKK
jgi:hypothetical protein